MSEVKPTGGGANKRNAADIVTRRAAASGVKTPLPLHVLEILLIFSRVASGVDLGGLKIGSSDGLRVQSSPGVRILPRRPARAEPPGAPLELRRKCLSLNKSRCTDNHHPDGCCVGAVTAESVASSEMYLFEPAVLALVV